MFLFRSGSNEEKLLKFIFIFYTVYLLFSVNMNTNKPRRQGYWKVIHNS